MDEDMKEAIAEMFAQTKAILTIANGDDELYELQGKNAWKVYKAYQAAGFSEGQAIQLTVAAIAGAAKAK